MASGNLLAYWRASEIEYPSTNPCNPGGDNDQQFQTFDDTTAENGFFTGFMPDTYDDSSGVTVSYGYGMATATSGNIRIEGTFERQPDTHDYTADSWGTVVDTADTAVPGTAQTQDILTKTHSDASEMDGVGSDDPFRFRVARDVGVASNASGNLELRWVAIHQQ